MLFGVLLARLLTDDPNALPAADLDAFFRAHRALVTDVASPIDRAVLGGLHADRVGYAFVAGYRNALQALAPELASDEIVALSATESAGNHPRAIETKLENGELTGRKRWTTLAGRASSFLVVASVGRDGDRNRLRVVRVRADQPGVRIIPMTEAPFVPEIPHAEVHLDRVKVAESDVLPGDGYDRYLKPFRTVEDLHVHGALLGYLVGVARRASWPRETIEELLALVASVRMLAGEEPLAPSTHVALAGLLSQAKRALERIEACWSLVDEGTRTRWERDRAILGVAGKARDARREAAWRSLQERQPRSE
jgi:alkylation response protein AidB-like acyl-CoA dehydrogenase